MDGNPPDPLPLSAVDVVNTLQQWPRSYEEIMLPQIMHWMQGFLVGDEDCYKYEAACRVLNGKASPEITMTHEEAYAITGPFERKHGY